MEMNDRRREAPRRTPVAGACAGRRQGHDQAKQDAKQSATSSHTRLNREARLTFRRVVAPQRRPSASGTGYGLD
jgi:hypothetical protein